MSGIASPFRTTKGARAKRAGYVWGGRDVVHIPSPSTGEGQGEGETGQKGGAHPANPRNPRFRQKT